MAFLFDLVLFIIICGIVDARLPWPDPKSGNQ